MVEQSDSHPASLVMQTSDGIERIFPLNKPRLLIGRETLCDVRVPVPDVASRHCEIVVNCNHISVNDLKSKSGTFHNGRRVDTAALSENDKLTIGPVTFIVRKQMIRNDDGETKEKVDIVIKPDQSHHAISQQTHPSK